MCVCVRCVNNKYNFLLTCEIIVFCAKGQKGMSVPATSSSVITAYSLGRIAGQVNNHLYCKFGVY